MTGAYSRLQIGRKQNMQKKKIKAIILYQSWSNSETEEAT
jgi:hypothetical protein